MHASSPLRSSSACYDQLVVCFLWTPITTTVSVLGCPYAIVFVSSYRDFLRKLLDFASPIVRDHHSAPSPSSDVCEPCDGCSMDMPSASQCSYHPWICRNVLRSKKRPMPREEKCPSRWGMEHACEESPKSCAARTVRVRGARSAPRRAPRGYCTSFTSRPPFAAPAPPPVVLRPPCGFGSSSSFDVSPR